MKLLEIVLKIPIKGGKNNYIVSRKGKHIPTKTFERWRDEAVYLIRQQSLHRNINNPNLIWKFTICPQDNIKRDATAILDAIFHCLERSRLITNDNIIKNLTLQILPSNPNDYFIKIEVFEGDNNEKA